MKTKVLRSGSPGVRLGLALAVSLVFHLALLLSMARLWHALPAESMLPPLDVRLVMPEPAMELVNVLATEPTPPSEPEPQVAPEPPKIEPPTRETPPAAVAPAPTIRPVKPPPRESREREPDTTKATLTRDEFYPREAIKQGIEGRVVLQLTMDEAGKVTAIDVASSSGHAVLDSAALKAATRIGQLPGGRHQLLLPVEFRLD